MPRLGVNIDHVATLRQARKTHYPDLLEAARISEKAGANQITCHLREDRRHIQDADVRALRQIVTTSFNLEMAATEEMLGIALEIKPDRVTLVPERRQELTTEGGLNLKNNFSSLKKSIQELQQGGVPVSLFINPHLEDIQLSKDLGVDAVELHTGGYADLPLAPFLRQAQDKLFVKRGEIEEVAKKGVALQLKIFAGHGLDYENISPLVKIKEIQEYNIGFSIIARAVFVGLDQAVREMRKIIS